LWDTQKEIEARYPAQEAKSPTPSDPQKQTPSAAEIQRQMQANREKEKVTVFEDGRLGSRPALPQKTIPSKPAQPAQPAQPSIPKSLTFTKNNLSITGGFCLNAGETYEGQSAKGRVISETVKTQSDDKRLSKEAILAILRANEGKSGWVNLEAVVDAVMQDLSNSWHIHIGTGPPGTIKVGPDYLGRYHWREVRGEDFFRLKDDYKVKTQDGKREAIITPIEIQMWINKDAADAKGY
jgi:hypothetical protein